MKKMKNAILLEWKLISTEDESVFLAGYINSDLMTYCSAIDGTEVFDDDGIRFYGDGEYVIKGFEEISDDCISLCSDRRYDNAQTPRNPFNKKNEKYQIYEDLLEEFAYLDLSNKCSEFNWRQVKYFELKTDTFKLMVRNMRKWERLRSYELVK